MKRALTVKNILNTKRKLMPFTGHWKKAFGLPELAGNWIIWGESGHGKTTFTLQLCKYLTNFSRVLYNSLEEGNSESFKLALIRAGLNQDDNNFLILAGEPISKLRLRLQKPKPPGVVVLDSFQYTGLSYSQYCEFVDEFPHILFIWISHAEGKKPEGRPANSVRYNSHAKIYVEGYTAHVQSRFRIGAPHPIVIWEEGAKNYMA